MYSFESMCHEKGFSCIAGVDEAGRGPLAGPVVSAAVILRTDYDLPGLNDSKKLSESRRKDLFARIPSQCLAIGIGIVSELRIDEINILRASLESMVLAVNNLSVSPDFLLIDGKFTLELPLGQQAIVGGDGKSASIAAASVVAKVTRDEIMKELDKEYPGYGLARHKGYPTRSHKDAIARMGVLPVHRRSFRGVSEFVR
ncbi:ribonuclease HII [Desulfobotulus mexicanus]|uniref:Ribonuclease HII n=1 Tax=Desulfobotulus mexicanus TaxID=2586642 RepID=A0A5Q4VF58_9BACT|nr:ribonuclease HII [Desulfobotulus mexicanus]TYT74902.1 ribonuclease HII [Desulfobotulus mexicanus]